MIQISSGLSMLLVGDVAVVVRIINAAKAPEALYAVAVLTWLLKIVIGEASLR